MNLLAGPEDLARFVPTFILNRLATQASEFDPSFADPAQVAILFADISGFTALSEKLAARGPDGVEELTQTLNAYFGKLIEIITAFGGDVVKFAGDAMLAFWPAQDREELSRATEFAAECGLQVQEALKTFGNTINHRLFLRIGVGSGDVFFVSLGGVFNRWESVMVGPSVIEATMATAKAEPGFVALGATAWASVRERATGVEIEPGYTRLVQLETRHLPLPLEKPFIPDQLSPQLLSFIPAAIHRRLAARQTGWLAELRRLTVLFVNLPALNAKTPLEKSKEVIRELQTSLYRFEGSVNKLSIDEKGVTLVAAFGLPPLSHEDDPQRGVLAALAIHKKLEDLGWHASVGVTSGRIFCGTIGSEVRCEYTIIGDVVNLSARLMQAAKGGILCDESTYKEVRSKVEWEVLQPIMVKGKSYPIPVFRPKNKMRSTIIRRSTDAMVGRVREQMLLALALEKLKNEQKSAIFIIEGEAGIGKSTLVAQLLKQAAEAGVTTWLGAAFPMERSTPYYLWRAIFKPFFQLDSTKPLEEQRKHVLESFVNEPDLLELAPLLDVVLSLEFPPTKTTEELFGEVRLHNTNELLVRLLKRYTHFSPLQLILEDCHWMDSASWALARQCAQQVPGLMLTIVTRPLSEPLPREYLPLATNPATQKLTLSPLTIDESLSLVKRRLGVTSIPTHLLEFLRNKTQGNPFFLEEITYALRDSGKLVVDDGQCRLAEGVDLARLPFPDHVQGVVTSRIDRLAPQEQLTLKVASVIGRTFSTLLLTDICPIEDDKPNLPKHLETLVGQSLTMLETPDPDPSFSFRHVITQEVAYQMMAPSQRKSLHQSVAEWYETQHKGDLSPYFPLLAKHWCNTDEIDKAIDYLEKSGENAMRDFAHIEAVAFFSQALVLDEKATKKCDPLRKARWRRQIAEAYYNLGDHVKSRMEFLTTLEMLGYPPKRATWRQVFSTMWEFTKQKVHRLIPSWFVGYATGDKAATRLEASRAYERLTQIYYLNNEKLPSIHATFRSLNLSETVGETPELARHYSHAAVICGLLMMHKTARAHAARARRVARAVNQSECTAYVEFIRAIYWVTVGEWEEALDNLNQAIEIANKIGQKRRWDESTFTLGNTYSRLGDYRQAERISEEVHRAGTLRGVPQVQIWGMTWQLHCLLVIAPDSPKIPQLEADLAKVLASHNTIAVGDQILAHGLPALSFWRRGEKERAKRSADAAQAIIEQSDQISHYLLPAFAGLTEVTLGLWQESRLDPIAEIEMRRRVRKLLGVLGVFAMSYPVGRPTKHLMKGIYQFHRGRSRKAFRLWRKSLASAVKFRMPLEQAEAHLQLALHLPDSDPLKATHRHEAIFLLNQVGAPKGRWLPDE